jgi:hypothetical protein
VRRGARRGARSGECRCDRRSIDRHDIARRGHDHLDSAHYTDGDDHNSNPDDDHNQHRADEHHIA